MKKETIEKYLDKCRVTPGPWDCSCKRYADKEGWRILSDSCGNSLLSGKGWPTVTKKVDANVLATSRNMLVALIGATYRTHALWINPATNNAALRFMIDPLNEIKDMLDVGIIEQALSRQWEEIRKELEEMEETKGERLNLGSGMNNMKSLSIGDLT